MCYDGDTVTLISERTQRASKPYRCAECRRDILKGEQCLYECWTFEGDFDSHRTCQQCAEARRWLKVVCSTWQYHAIIDELREHFCEEDLLRTAALGRLILSAERKWRTKRDDVIPVERVAHWVDEALEHITLTGVPV